MILKNKSGNRGKKYIYIIIDCYCSDPILPDYFLILYYIFVFLFLNKRNICYFGIILDWRKIFTTFI